MENDEIALHCKKNDCWIVIHSKVYDITDYLEKHPGGSSILLGCAGRDATKEFVQTGHSQNANKILDKYEIGELIKHIQPTTHSWFQTFILWFQTIISWLYHKQMDTRAQLIRRTQITHDTVRLVFGVQHIDLKCGQHLICYNGDKQRKYTPIQTTHNSFELIVKVYDVGGMSAYLNSLQIGDRLTVSEPVGNKIYCGNGIFSNLNIQSQHMIMICAGTGITPMYQILRKITENGENMYVTVLYVNKTTNDILLQHELEQMCFKFSNISINYSFTRNQTEIKPPLLKGRPTKEMVMGLCKCDLALICGPSGFNNSVSAICKELGYATQIF